MTSGAAIPPGPLLPLDALHDLEPGQNVELLEVSRETTDAVFREGHIPGARFVNWKQLCWHPSERRFADADTLRRRLARIGITASLPLGIYGDPVQYGTYAYWTLTNAGLEEALYLLDGTLETWKAEGREPEAGGPPARTSGEADANAGTADRRASCSVGRDDVLRVLGEDTVQILDVRSDEEYSGERVSPSTMEVDHGAERTGRIPGALHLPYQELLTSDGRFRSGGEIRKLAEEAGLRPDSRVIVYCRLSHRASLVWFALTRIAGREQVQVYDGSWTEWGSMVGMPIER